MQADDFLCIVTVAQTRNITQAAEKLYMTQPALSRKITAIEKSIGVKLFERSTRSVSLTRAGQIYYEHAVKIVAEYQLLCSELFNLQHTAEGTIRIGYPLVMGNPDYLVRMITLLSQQYPKIKTELIAEPSPKLMSDAEDGNLDCIIIASNYLVEKSNYERIKIHPLQMFCVVPNEHPLAGKKVIEVERLRDESFIMMSQDHAPNLGRSSMEICEKAGFTPNVVAYANSVEELLLLVRTGRGIALLSSDIQGSMRSDVTIRPVDIPRPTPADRVMAWRKDCKNELVTILADTLKQVIAETQSN